MPYNSIRHFLPLYTMALGCAVFAGPTTAQEPTRVPTGIDWLDWATEQVAFTMREAVPAEKGENTSPDSSEMPVLSPTHSIETMEMMRLQQEIRLLRELIEEGVVNRVIALESEVRDLKNALNGQRGSGPVIPQPNAPAQAQLPIPGASPDMAAALAEATQSRRIPPPASFSFTVVEEWGRSPEVVAELGGNTSTLIGIAGLVPPGSAREDLFALARELHAKYTAYDNVVIEVFDSEPAAEAFGEKQTVNAERRVLSISKARTDGRDIMLYFGGPIPEPVPPQ